MFEENGFSRDFLRLAAIPGQRPHAAAVLRGSGDNANLHGQVWFYQTERGVLVAAELTGLPTTQEPCASPIFAFHIHDGVTCSGDHSEPFSGAMGHFDPDGCPHPYHAGDLPPLFGSKGYALSIFLTDRFAVPQVLGKTVIVHAQPDDFTTQPSGNAGARIACGEIRRFGQGA